MRLEANDISGAIANGIGATLLMDLWNLFLKRAFSIQSLNFCLVGRGIVFALVFVFLRPSQARLKSLATHTVFGVGLFVYARGLSDMLRLHA